MAATDEEGKNVFANLEGKQKHIGNRRGRLFLHPLALWLGWSGTCLFLGLEGYWGQPHGPNFPSPRAIMLVYS